MIRGPAGPLQPLAAGCCSRSEPRGTSQGRSVGPGVSERCLPRLAMAGPGVMELDEGGGATHAGLRPRNPTRLKAERGPGGQWAANFVSCIRPEARRGRTTCRTASLRPCGQRFAPGPESSGQGPCRETASVTPGSSLQESWHLDEVGACRGCTRVPLQLAPRGDQKTATGPDASEIFVVVEVEVAVHFDGLGDGGADKIVGIVAAAA